MKLDKDMHGKDTHGKIDAAPSDIDCVCIERLRLSSWHNRMTDYYNIADKQGRPNA